jgi:DNA-binding transcriptional MerR regulator
VAEREHLSIGEVLSLLREEFPDITISKIRFLESQGLLDPERTPSGYRKFYEPDVERLRWILRQQREHFLPLKVIKGRLLGGGTAVEEAPSRTAEHAQARTAVGAATTASASASATSAIDVSDEPGLSAGPSGVNLTLEELTTACGLPASQVAELEKFGLLAGKPVGGTIYYDEEALLVANLAAGFLRYGVEARHLRMYKNAAERESGLFEQVVMPMIKQRNPQARQQAVVTLDELANLSIELRRALLRQALGNTF